MDVIYYENILRAPRFSPCHPGFHVFDQLPGVQFNRDFGFRIGVRDKLRGDFSTGELEISPNLNLLDNTEGAQKSELFIMLWQWSSVEQGIQ